MRFSVIIPTYNRLCMLQQTVQSVLNQSYKDFELIIVDDGSTDGTDNYLSSLSGAVILRQSNKGPAAARNMAAKHATGDYLAFLDSDDLWMPWTLETFAHSIATNHSEFISARVQEFEGEPPEIDRTSYACEKFSDFLKTASNPENFIAGGMVVSKRLFDCTAGFDGAMRVGEDADFSFRAGTEASFVRISSPVTLAYRIHPGSTWRVPMDLFIAMKELIAREAAGKYPGGKARQRDRWALITRASRPAVFTLLNAGMRREAWDLFCASFLMNAKLGRMRFIVGFLLKDFLLETRRMIESCRQLSEAGRHGRIANP